MLHRKFAMMLVAWAAALFGGAAGAADKPMPPEVARAWSATGLPSSALSMVIEEVQGDRLAAVNGAEFKNPASVMKLVTTWAALSELGPDYVWQTAFLIDNNATVSDDGVLSGPVYLRPTGDPVIMLEDLWRLMRELRLRGIRQINDIVVDRSPFGEVAIDPAEFDGKGDRPYNASPDVFMVGFGAVRLVFTPDLQAKRWRAFVDPPIPGIEIDSDIKYQDGSCRRGPRVSVQTVNGADDVRFRVSGEAHGACGEFDFYRLAFDQQAFAARTLKTMWRELGGTMTGTVKDGSIPADAVPLAAHQSPPLAEVIRLVNKRSNNVMTRVLLLTLGAQAGQRPATVAGSAEVVKRILTAQGIELGQTVIENGSGLSRNARISADVMADMLQHAWRSPAMPEYVSSMAILGVDGTLKRRLRGDDARGYANMKTGALKDARAIAGYVLSKSGKRYVFVSLVNHPQAYKARDFENAVMAWLNDR
ncbi:D-alanyl-D-alanine carboxypeptidase/D-alanyl-D-alanine endopeptidase [Orrella daihaiensis]|uniref:D-alanyl-D-alanine carboxypeptidase/D-alanyl-D-alanine-endopeptidase n=1 Tax=Orrella daihaiensis TaxID=2782176 RepID=A0ABY4ANY4_9BURK|nr:D-alanyl-D-alanine carboxypeptidase/D-alanyl-D-alanine-endopeptidase [Orrella daihaiensis]UOD51110.1 D-alanyl-D-alanine carboxypeptidase/D-alanyl-D-alanine-endopeptidase [Orrella daihaiensis]